MIKNNGSQHQAVIVAYLFLLMIAVGFVSSSAQAATKIYVQNDTDATLTVKSIDVSGDPLSKKAWKKGEELISPGQRVSVLSINRTGKFNWMDPTPRYIEPGKTAVFSIELAAADKDAENSQPVLLRQKLLGTGSGSKMWYAIAGTESKFDWALAPSAFNGVWQTVDKAISFRYHTLKSEKDTHVEYVFSEQGG